MMAAATVAVMLLCSHAFAAEGTSVAEEIIPKVNDGTKIVINLASRGLYLFEQGIKSRLYPIACGKPAEPTPVGYFKVIDKTVNPVWQDSRDSDNVVYSGPDNPLGYRWIGIGGYYGIHGTNNPASIGSYASRGCIRMLEENVEELFDRVEVGTPVEIFYNRVVVEKAADDRVAYYIYPDSYGRQSLTVDQINEWLHGFGVECFESDEAIAAKIDASDGQPTFIAKSYNIEVNGRKLKSMAVEKDGSFYLPIQAMADELDIPVFFDRDNELVSTRYGTANARTFKKILFLTNGEIEHLLHLHCDTARNLTLVYYTTKE